MIPIDAEKVCFVAIKAREIAAAGAEGEPDSASNPTDDNQIATLSVGSGDAAYEETERYIDNLTVDDRTVLLALAWLGRDDYTIDEWEKALLDARHADIEDPARYLLGMPLLGEYLELGLSAHAISCDPYKEGRL